MCDTLSMRGIQILVKFFSVQIKSPQFNGIGDFKRILNTVKKV